MSEATHALSARARRFGRRLRGERDPGFADLVRQRETERSARTGDERLPITLALLQAKPALDGELNGSRLQTLAGLLGDELLDAVRDTDVREVAPDILVPFLPPATVLARQGQTLLDRVSENAQIARLAQLAIKLVNAAASDERARA